MSGKKKKTRAAFFSFGRLLLLKLGFKSIFGRMLFFKIFFIYKYIKIIIFYF
jgi:hypothetical protein